MEYGEKHVQEALRKTAGALGVAPDEISGVTVLKKGMTNAKEYSRIFSEL